MKNLILVAAATLFALPATEGLAYGYCVPPQPTVTVIKKTTYQPVVKVFDTRTKPSFSRRPVVKPVGDTRCGTNLTVGSTVTAPCRFLGHEVGAVFLQVGPASLECEVLAWSKTSVTFVVPNMGLGPVTKGKLQIVRGDGDIVRQYPVSLIRKPDLIVHEKPAPLDPFVMGDEATLLPQE